MKIQLTVIGTKPMLQHNERLANPLDPYTRRLKQITGKRNKTDDDYADIMAVEARGGAWETPDGLLAVKNQALWSSIREGAKAFKRGEDIKRGFVMDDGFEPILTSYTTRRGWTGTVKVDDFLSDPAHVDYRSVRVQSSRTMRARPLIPLPWASVHTAELLDDVLDLHAMTEIFERAGRLVGLGDWRPTYGTYRLEVVAL